MSEKCMWIRRCENIVFSHKNALRTVISAFTWSAAMNTSSEVTCHLGRVKQIWYLSPLWAAKVQASLCIRAVCQNRRCSLLQAVSQEEPSDRKPDPWPLWGNARRHKCAWRATFSAICLVENTVVRKKQCKWATPWEKCVFGSLRPGQTQTGLRNHRS